MLLPREFVRWHASYAACTKPLQRWANYERRTDSAALVHNICMFLPSAATLPWQLLTWLLAGCEPSRPQVRLLPGLGESLHSLHKRNYWAVGRCMAVSIAFLVQVWRSTCCAC